LCARCLKKAVSPAPRASTDAAMITMRFFISVFSFRRFDLIIVALRELNVNFSEEIFDVAEKTAARNEPL
jgi:hypothetical protein